MVSRTLAESGEFLSEKSQLKIKALTDSYYEAKELKLLVQKLKYENNQLKKIADERGIKNPNLKEHPSKSGSNPKENKFEISQDDQGHNYNEIRSLESYLGSASKNQLAGSERKNIEKYLISDRKENQRDDLSQWEIMRYREESPKEDINELDENEGSCGEKSFNNELDDCDDEFIEESKRNFYEKMEEVETQLSFLQKKSYGSN